MNVLYYSTQVINENDGVTKKMLSQISSIKKLGFEVDFLYPRPDAEGGRICINQEVLCHDIHSKNSKKAIINYVLSHNYEIVYIRYLLAASPSFLKILKAIKHTGAKIYLEIPTYPYDGELNLKSYHSVVSILVERTFRNMLKKYVDFVVTTSLFKEIFGIKAINISNAPAVIPPLHSTNNNPNIINLVSVANVAFWHGYDRLLHGIKNYYSQENKIEISFTLIGNSYSGIIDELKSLAYELGIERYVSFPGPKDGKELDRYFENADIAVGCLGCHRKKIREVKALKNVEYAMRGIPFIYSEDNSDFDRMPYVLKIPADETPVDIFKVINFYKELKLTPREIKSSVSSMTWDTQMSVVFNT